MNNINNMNINIFNPMPVNPAKNLMMNQTALDNQDLLENFAKMNVKNDSDVFNNNSNKRAIAYNYYFGGGDNNLEFEREKEDIYRIENWDSLNHHSNNFSNSNHHYMPSNPYGPSIQNLNSNFQKYNTYNNNNPTPINNHNHKVAGYKIQSNKISNPIGKYGEINNRVKSYGNKYYDSNGADMKGKLFHI